MTTLIYAQDQAGGIGFQNKLPWPRIAEDMRRFKDATTGHVVLMGRQTFDSIGGKPLKGRSNIVMTRDVVQFWRNRDFQISDGPDNLTVTTMSGLPKAILDSDPFCEVFIIGGAEIYQQTIGIVDRILRTVVAGQFPADTSWIPDLSNFTLVTSEPYEENGKLVCTFEEWKRNT